MKIRNHQMGEFDVPEDSLVHLADGLVGYEDQDDFFLVGSPEFQPFLWLISAKDHELAFAIADSEILLAEPYVVTMTELDREQLDLNASDSIRVFLIASPAEPPGWITVNLKGPLLLNPRNRVAKQVLVYSSKLPLRQPVWDAAHPLAGSVPGRTKVRVIGKKAA